ADALPAIEELLFAALLAGTTLPSLAATRAAPSWLNCHASSPLFGCRRYGHRLGRRLLGEGSGNRTHALLLRVALRELLRTFVIEVRAHDHVAQNPIGVPHAPIELGERAFRLEHEEVVVAFIELLDGVCETAAAPRFFVR